MSGPSQFAERLRQALAPTERGAVGAVDALLASGRESPLRFEWQGGVCRVHSAEGAMDAPLPKSVFRAILARLAALCNERVADSVTPYGGSGELAFDGSTFRVTFANTPDEQRAEVAFVAAHAESGRPVAPAAVAPVTSPNSA